jgi:hypothetical protein
MFYNVKALPGIDLSWRRCGEPIKMKIGLLEAA